MRRRTRILAGVLVLVALGLALEARAAGFGRPSIVGAPAVGMGGAYAAIADDATAIYHNPAGISLYPQTSFLLDIGVVIPDRQYQPADCSVTAPDLPACANGVTTGARRTEHEMMTPTLVPAFAFSTRFGSAHGEGASRLAIGFATFLTQGGSVAFSDKLSYVDRLGVRKSNITLLEFVPAVAYQASDFLAVGAGLRIGVGFFDLDATTLYSTPAITPPVSVSTVGVTAGASLGVMVRPLQRLNLAFVYRTAMKVPASGSIDVDAAGSTPASHSSLNVDLRFPQQFSVGAAVKPIERLRLAVQLDWTNWSSLDHLTLKYPPSATEIYLNFNDSWTGHVGAEYFIGDAMVARLGYAIDTKAVPDATMERQYVDGLKHSVGAGFGYAITKRFRGDAAFEYLFAAPTRTVAASPATVPVGLQNVAPGSYKAAAYQVVLTGQFRY
jgi:long-chain fatty acid transport protein